MSRETVLFTDGDITLSIPVTQENTVWLTLDQMSGLFDAHRSVLARCIEEIFEEGELDRETCVKRMGACSDRDSQEALQYSLEVILAVGYRVHTPRSSAFRKWVHTVLRDFMVKDSAAEKSGKMQDGTVQTVGESASSGEGREVLRVMERYSSALDLLDEYDHQTMRRPKGTGKACRLTYEECRSVIQQMRFGNESDLFGREKDDSFKGSIGNIYQTFAEQDLYPSGEEKAANLLYFVVKNHSFLDGNKRIAAAMFLYFLDRMGVLFDEHDRKKLDDRTLVALTIMTAESRPEEKEMMISVIMNCIG